MSDDDDIDTAPADDDLSALFAVAPRSSFPALPLERGIPLLHKCLQLAIDMADSLDELHAGLRANRGEIDRVQRHRPDLWAELRDRTNRRRAEFTGLTADSPPAA